MDKNISKIDRINKLNNLKKEILEKLISGDITISEAEYQLDRFDIDQKQLLRKEKLKQINKK